MKYQHSIKRWFVICIMCFFFLNFLMLNSFSSVKENKEAYSSSISFSKTLKNANFVPERFSIDIMNSEVLTHDETVIVEYIFNDKLLEKKCEFDVAFENKYSYQKKVYCPIPPQSETGVYSLSLFVKDENNNQIEPVKLSEISVYYNSNESKYPIEFRDVEEGTQVTIAINHKFDDNNSVVIHHQIPKEVIAEITPQNRGKLIASQKEFSIVEVDPIISWEVGPKDEELEYTLLDTSVDENTKSKFNTYEPENNALTQGIIIIIIVLILLFIFVPFFFKCKHS